MIARGAVVAMVAACAPARPPPATELERTVDRRVDPCNDFYAYACGGWLASHPIPPDRSSISVYGLIEDADRAKEQAIAEEAAAQRAPADPRVQHVGG
ncbi:MAG TPA: hypothetical protein VLX92_33970, partial [Kofleriaceae bacterium]|nr:hypothetical protein [Kofleriaceae bacterium]